MEKVNSYDYRKYYERITELTIPDNLQIHHVDGDRDNNTIENLVALPIDIHQLYHRWLQENDEMLLEHIPTRIKGVLDNGHAYLHYIHKKLSEFDTIYYECMIWVDYRDYLLNKMTNIHKIQKYNKPV